MTATQVPDFVQPTPMRSATRPTLLVQDTSFLTVIRVLLLIQGGIGLTSFLEVTVTSLGLGVPLFALMGLNLCLASMTLFLANRITRRGRKARRTVLWLQYGWLAIAAVDLLLSLFMTQRLLEPVPTLTRIVVPIALVRTLRSPHARLLFNVPPTRRQRRKARRQARVAEAAT